jgi:hypothetical protein
MKIAMTNIVFGNDVAFAVILFIFLNFIYKSLVLPVGA